MIYVLTLTRSKIESAIFCGSKWWQLKMVEDYDAVSLSVAHAEFNCMKIHIRSLKFLHLMSVTI